MKKRFRLLMIVAFAFSTLAGCEHSTQLRTATISEITAAGSENYGVRVNFLDDTRLEGKGVDVQIKFNKKGTITMWQENQEKFDYEILESDEWYSLTTIFTIKDKIENSNTENFELNEEARTKTYLFNYKGEGGIEVTFRAVAGDKQENAYKLGEILVDSTPISDQFTLKIK